MGACSSASSSVSVMMHTRFRCVWRAAIAVLVFTGAAVNGHADAPALDDYVTRGLVDLRATVSATKADPAELEKINRDFAALYRLRNLTLSIAAPDRFRFENEIGMYLVNGATRYYRVKALRIKKREEIGNQPGKRPSLLDLGLVTPDVLAALEWRYVRDEPVDSSRCAVFDVTFRQDPSIHYRMWIDPKTRIVLRREWRDAAGKLRAVFLCREPREVKPGIWLPTRIEARNAEDAVAGVLSYTDILVNSGLDASLFSIPQ